LDRLAAPAALHWPPELDATEELQNVIPAVKSTKTLSGNRMTTPVGSRMIPTT